MCNMTQLESLGSTLNKNTNYRSLKEAFENQIMVDDALMNDSYLEVTSVSKCTEGCLECVIARSGKKVIAEIARAQQ